MIHNSLKAITSQGNMDDILHDKQKIEYTEIFKDIKGNFVLLIEGRPGSGKSTFVHKITRAISTTSVPQSSKSLKQT